jgi:hypothetical protein
VDHVIRDLTPAGFRVGVEGSWVEVAEGEPQQETFVPWHRVLRVVGPEGELFRKPGLQPHRVSLEEEG